MNLHCNLYIKFKSQTDTRTWTLIGAVNVYTLNCCPQIIDMTASFLFQHNPFLTFTGYFKTHEEIWWIKKDYNITDNYIWRLTSQESARACVWFAWCQVGSCKSWRGLPWRQSVGHEWRTPFRRRSLVMLSSQRRWVDQHHLHRRRTLYAPPIEYLMIHWRTNFSERGTYVHVRYMISAFRLSSVCLSVTLVHPAQPVEIFGNFFTIR